MGTPKDEDEIRLSGLAKNAGNAAGSCRRQQLRQDDAVGLKYPVPAGYPFNRPVLGKRRDRG
jgi:hypothetical protein